MSLLSQRDRIKKRLLVTIVIRSATQPSMKQKKVFEQIYKLPIVTTILAHLEHRLPKHLKYHTVTHTKRVLATALELAATAGVSERELELVSIAAAFHDAGFLEGRRDHEITSARLAAHAMRSSGEYNSDEIESVKSMILDTRLIESAAGVSQFPSSELGCYLLDADLENLGSADFFEYLELQRLESGTNKVLAARQALELLKAHSWHTDAAELRFQATKEHNLRQLANKLAELEQPEAPALIELPTNRLKYLAQLPLLLNSASHLRQVITLSLQHIKKELQAEAASVLLLDSTGERLTFWALQGGAANQLKDKQMLADKGIAGWVIGNQRSALVQDTSNDPRFYQEIDRNLDFSTKNMLCVPLTARRHTPLGAIQLINSTSALGFTEEDLYFLEQFSCQTALAIENVNLREAIQARHARLEAITERKDQLINLIGNSLLNPIEQILNTCHNLAAPDNFRREQGPLISELRNSCQQVEEIVKRVSLLAQLDKNDLLPNRQKIQVAELIDQLHEVYASTAEEAGIHLQSEISTKTREVMVDHELILIALGNLVENALEATPSGGTVSLRAEVIGELIQVQVADTGIGIPQSEQPLLFDKFFQTQASMLSSKNDQDQQEHLGIGLALAQGIVRTHGSLLQVDSTPQKGTVFSFTLEAVKSDKV